MTVTQAMGYVKCRFQRGLKRKPLALMKKLRKAVSLSCSSNSTSNKFLSLLLRLSTHAVLTSRLVLVLQKREADEGEKPEAVRTHLRNMIIVPEMIGSVIGVYNGKIFNQIEIKVRQL